MLDPALISAWHLYELNNLGVHTLPEPCGAVAKMHPRQSDFWMPCGRAKWRCFADGMWEMTSQKHVEASARAASDASEIGFDVGIAFAVSLLSNFVRCSTDAHASVCKKKALLLLAAAYKR